MKQRAWLVAAIAGGLLTTACTSATPSPSGDPDASAPDASVDGAAARDGAADSRPLDGSGATAPFACGSAQCAAGQFCVSQCTCGGAALCEPLSDGGACPLGSHEDPLCARSGTGGGCIRDCANPPPSCADVAPPNCSPTSSPGHVACSCPP